MADISLVLDPNTQSFDWPSFDVLSAPATSDHDLQTALEISLFTDRVAPADYVGDPRGCWTDTFDGPFGSRIWMLERTTTAGALQRAKDYAQEAVAWIVADKMADKIDVAPLWLSSTALGIPVAVSEPRKTTPRKFDYSLLWRGI